MMNIKPYKRETEISIDISYEEAGTLFGLFRLGRNIAKESNRPELERELFALESRLLGAWTEVKK